MLVISMTINWWKYIYRCSNHGVQKRIAENKLFLCVYNTHNETEHSSVQRCVTRVTPS